MVYYIQSIDYAVLVIAIIFYAIIGIYFGCFGSKQKSAKEYVYGKRSLKAIPIGLSIYSSAVSALSMIGIPQEIYIFGGQYFLHIIGAFMSLIITWIFVIPVFNGGNKKYKTPYEYYENRFGIEVRYISSTIYIINNLSAIPIVLYICVLPISEATGADVFLCAVLLGGVCVIYTMLGGFTTVVWTDVAQALLMLSSLILLAIVSVVKAGGFQTIWEHAQKTGRTNFFNFDLNPFMRLNFWSCIIGTMFNYAAHQGCAASTLQRYLSVDTEKDAKISVFIGVCGFVFNTLMGIITAFCMLTIYYGCDPVANKELNNYNQLAPHFALEVLSIVPGLSGVLIAGLLSAGLSSLSAELNTISGMIYYDFIQKNLKKYNSDKKGALIMKLLVFIFGVYFIVMVYLVQRIKYLISIAVTIAGVANGLKLGLLILGSAFPKSNSKGVLVGMLISGIFMSWLAISATIYNVGSINALPVSTDNCTHTNDTIFNEESYLNFTTVLPPLNNLSSTAKPEPFFMYKLSFMYYTMFGCFITICISLIVSYATGGNNFKNMDEKLFIPCARPKKRTQHIEELQDMLQKDMK